MISLTCDYHPAAPDDATIHHAAEILSSGTHVSSSQKTKRVEVIFGRKSGAKIETISFTPPPKVVES